MEGGGWSRRGDLGGLMGTCPQGQALVNHSLPRGWDGAPRPTGVFVSLVTSARPYSVLALTVQFVDKQGGVRPPGGPTCLPPDLRVGTCKRTPGFGSIWDAVGRHRAKVPQSGDADRATPVPKTAPKFQQRPETSQATRPIVLLFRPVACALSAVCRSSALASLSGPRVTSPMLLECTAPGTRKG